MCTLITETLIAHLQHLIEYLHLLDVAQLNNIRNTLVKTTVLWSVLATFLIDCGNIYLHCDNGLDDEESPIFISCLGQ